jgi:hypothetical protein
MPPDNANAPDNQDPRRSDHHHLAKQREPHPLDSVHQDQAKPKSPDLPPYVTLPQGGAIRGIGKNLSVNAVTGTAGLTIPLVSGSGQSGFTPGLELKFDSGSGIGHSGRGRRPAPDSRCERRAASRPEDGRRDRLRYPHLPAAHRRVVLSHRALGECNTPVLRIEFTWTGRGGN